MEEKFATITTIQINPVVCQALNAWEIVSEACANECADRLKSLYLSQGRPAQEECLLVAAVDDCTNAIRLAAIYPYLKREEKG